jgi:hypothetical protein
VQQCWQGKFYEQPQNCGWHPRPCKVMTVVQMKRL